MSDDLKPEDLINIRSRGVVPKKEGTKIDQLVSDAVGKPVATTNPILIAKLAEWKKEKEANPYENPSNSQNFAPDNWLDDPAKVEELKKALQ